MTPNRFILPFQTLAGLTLATLLVAAPAVAGQAAAPADDAARDLQVEAPSLDALPVTVAGMTVSIDPETGELRPPSAEELEALRAAAQATFGGDRLAPKTVVQRSADGMLAARVDLSMLDFSVAHIGPDGTVSYRCVDGPEQATSHVHGHGEEK